MSFSILGTAMAVPEYVMTNDELSTIVDTTDEWISTRTGIKRRRVCKSETMTELCVKAANDAMADAGITAKDLDLIIKYIKLTLKAYEEYSSNTENHIFQQPDGTGHSKGNDRRSASQNSVRESSSL